MYNLMYSPFKLARASHGDVVLHNTAIKVGTGYRIVHNPSYVFSRNNLVIGGSGAGPIGRYTTGEGRGFYMAHADSTCDMDYDGLGVSGVPFRARIGSLEFGSIEELRTSFWEKHAIEVTMDVFASEVPFPDPPIPERPVPDLRLRANGAAVDAGAVIEGFSTSFRGKAPDLGAYELGEELPHYGPRPREN